MRVGDGSRLSGLEEGDREIKDCEIDNRWGEGGGAERRVGKQVFRLYLGRRL